MNPQVSWPNAGDDSSQTAYQAAGDPAGLGVRTIGSDPASGALLDVIGVTADLGRPGTVEMAVRERATRFASSSLRGVSPIVRVDRQSSSGRLEISSRRADGFRLSAVLEWTEARGVPSSLAGALTVGDRLLGAVSSLQAAEDGPGASGHGAIAVDQIVVSEAGEITLTDYAFSTTLAALQWPRDRMWRRFRIAMPPAAGLTRFDHRVDVTQAAVVICALLLGRQLRAEEYPRDLDPLVAEAARRLCGEDQREERNVLTAWLRAATELNPRRAFTSAAAAREALRSVLGRHVNDVNAVRSWLREARGGAGGSEDRC